MRPGVKLLDLFGWYAKAHERITPRCGTAALFWSNRY